MKIACAGWKLNRDEVDILNNISDYIGKNTKAMMATTDVFRETIRNFDYYIAFGDLAFKEIEEDHVFSMPAIKKLKATKQESMEKLKTIIKEINKIENEKPVQTHVELECGTTIGKEACDINISEKEAEHLKTLKALLNGSKMVLVKGDIRIEVE